MATGGSARRDFVGPFCFQWDLHGFTTKPLKLNLERGPKGSRVYGVYGYAFKNADKGIPSMDIEKVFEGPKDLLKQMEGLPKRRDISRNAKDL